MCRNIKTLFNFDPPATDEEIRAASLQFVRKLSGFNKPSKTNEAAFHQAIEEVAAIARSLIDSLETSAEPRDREIEAQRARARAAARFGTACALLLATAASSPPRVINHPPILLKADAAGAQSPGLRCVRVRAAFDLSGHGARSSKRCRVGDQPCQGI